MEFKRYKSLVRSIEIGKRLPDAVYLHESATDVIPAELTAHLARAISKRKLDEIPWNIVKFFTRDHKMTLLHYPAFFEDSYPALQTAYTMDLEKGTYRKASYDSSENPPILHRCETFLCPSHPAVPQLQEITQEGEAAGLYTNTKTIGFRKSWNRVIAKKGLALVGGRLVSAAAAPRTDMVSVEEGTVEVQRHLTAINRDRLSVPMQVLARHNYLKGDYSVFDYGCGKGDDLRELEAHGLDVSGWDPVHRPDVGKRQADFVNLGYVLNVIEDPIERSAALVDAFTRAEKALLVSVMLGGEATTQKFRPYGDGVITARNTFQKYYSQGEFRAYLETTLDETAIAASPGIFLIFKDKLEEQTFLSNRHRVSRSWKQITERERTVAERAATKTQIEKHPELFDDFWRLCLDLGRIPANSEFEFSDRMRTVAGSHRRAFEASAEHYGVEAFHAAERARRDELLVYFALGLFGRRRPYVGMPESLQRDVKVFFEKYTVAATLAKELLFSVGDVETIEEACIEAHQKLGCGDLDEGHSLTIHRSLLHEIPSTLQVYVGCATQLYGDIDDVDVVKIHMTSGKVTLLKYDDFEGSPVPNLTQRTKIKMRVQQIDVFDYTGEFLPQPLYLKSKLLRKGFANFSKQVAFDKKLLGLDIGTFEGFGPGRDEFLEMISEAGYAVSGFRLVAVRR